MVANSSREICSSQHDMNPDEEARSSGESSVLKSPTHFGTSFPPPHGNSFRCPDQLVQGAAAITAPQYDYTVSLAAQQPPLLEAPLRFSDANAHAAAYRNYYTVTLPPRNEISHDYADQDLSHLSHSGRPIVRAQSTSERRLSSGPSSHDSSQPAGEAETSVDKEPPIGNEKPSTNTTMPKQPRGYQRTVSTVVIACRQCRGRKIRCDSTRPVCNNCVRRSNVCEYDLVPKRRGPDKNPGTRHRRCKKRPPDDSTITLPLPNKRQRIAAMDRLSSPSDLVPAPLVPIPKYQENTMASDTPSASSSNKPLERSKTRERLQDHSASPYVANGHSPMSHRYFSYASEEAPAHINSSVLQQLDVGVTREQRILVPKSLGVKETQRMWWDTFLEECPLTQIAQDLRYLFTDTGHWLFFLNLEHFTKTLMDSEARLSIQPALIYAGLAMATLMKSSEAEFKAPGRERALWLRDNAAKLIQNSIESEWIDASLAEAALIIALFETSAHPMYNPDRVEQALLTLDFIIRTTSLTTIDSSDPDVLIYPVGCVPMTDPPAEWNHSSDRKCTCLPEPSDAPHAHIAQVPNPYSSWSYIPAWNAGWTDNEVHDEECRRLCWASLSLVCNYVSQCVAFDREPPNFFLLDSANYALLFPGEALDRMSPTYRSSTSSTKESVWALYCRSMLLWNFTNQLRMTVLPDDEKVELIYDAWSEAQSLQDSLRMHTCNLDTVLIYMSREYVYNTQITITQTLRRLQGLGNGPPIFKRKQAEEWLWYQDRVIRTVRSAIDNLGGDEGYQLTRRPYQVTWFANQLSICLLLWDYDRSLKDALVLAKSILVPVEVMTSLWPCAALEHQLEDLRKRLGEACAAEGIEPPVPSNFQIGLLPQWSRVEHD